MHIDGHIMIFVIKNLDQVCRWTSDRDVNILAIYLLAGIFIQELDSYAVIRFVFTKFEFLPFLTFEKLACVI